MGVHFDGGVLGLFCWGLVCVGVVLMLRALPLHWCFSWVFWPGVGAAIVGVIWLYVHGLLVI